MPPGRGYDPAMTDSNAPAPYDHVGAIMAYEQGELDDVGTLDLFAHLLRTGDAWALQGHYGRTAAALIDAGYLNRDGSDGPAAAEVRDA